jgi:hypothetical protein
MIIQGSISKHIDVSFLLKAIGLPELLDLLITFADQLPNLDEVVVGRGLSLGEKAAHAFSKCLTASKSETRSKAETLLSICVKVRKGSAFAIWSSCSIVLYLIFFAEWCALNWSHQEQHRTNETRTATKCRPNLCGRARDSPTA